MVTPSHLFTYAITTSQISCSILTIYSNENNYEDLLEPSQMVIYRPTPTNYTSTVRHYKKLQRLKY
jgi:hypothetical protein